MNARRTIVRRAFWSDLNDAGAWYDEHVPGLSEALEDAVIETIFRIEERPESFPVWREPIRRALVKGFPYRIGFAVEESDVFVIGLVHGMRDLPRWLSRRVEEE